MPSPLVCRAFRTNGSTLLAADPRFADVARPPTATRDRRQRRSARSVARRHATATWRSGFMRTDRFDGSRKCLKSRCPLRPRAAIQMPEATSAHLSWRTYRLDDEEKKGGIASGSKPCGDRPAYVARSVSTPRPRGGRAGIGDPERRVRPDPLHRYGAAHAVRHNAPSARARQRIRVRPLEPIGGALVGRNRADGGSETASRPPPLIRSPRIRMSR